MDVVEELSTGWLKVRPPAGSFSMIETRHIAQIAPNQPNWVVQTDGNVGVYVGTDVPKDKPSLIEGCRLVRGAQVVGVGPARMEGSLTYLPIEAPAREFRYLHADAVQRANNLTVVSGQGPAGSASQLTEAESLWLRAEQAERNGSVVEAINFYTQAAEKAQTAHPELALQARNRAYWLQESLRGTHSTFTPSPLPAGDYRLTPVSQGVQINRPVATTVANASGQRASTGPGRLRRAGRSVDGRLTYVLDALDGRSFYYVTPEPGVDLEPLLNRNVELFGSAIYSGELRANYMRVDRRNCCRDETAVSVLQ